MSRRSYYIYKRKLYCHDVFNRLKESIYNSPLDRLSILLLNDDTDVEVGTKVNKLIAEQFPNRKDIFHDIDKQKAELNKTNKEIESIISKFKNKMNAPIQNYKLIPNNATIKEELIRCGKTNCNECPHGPYYYAYWRDKTNKKLKKKYLGVIDPR